MGYGLDELPTEAHGLVDELFQGDYVVFIHLILISQPPPMPSTGKLGMTGVLKKGLWNE